MRHYDRGAHDLCGGDVSTDFVFQSLRNDGKHVSNVDRSLVGIPRPGVDSDKVLFANHSSIAKDATTVGV
jgi:hypothetical protein